jgi:hypothetical protein
MTRRGRKPIDGDSQCATTLTRLVQDADGGCHVYRMMPDGGEIEVRPAPEWDGTPFGQLTLPNASGSNYEGLAEALFRAGLRTVADLVDAWQVDDPRLRDGATQMPGQKDSRPMFATRRQIRLFLKHLQQRRAAWQQARENQSTSSDFSEEPQGKP